jgi:putative aldouronate transport system substrate-binding protein
MLNIKRCIGIAIAVMTTVSLFTSCSLNKSKEQSRLQEGAEKNTSEKAPVKLNWYIQASWYNKRWDSKVTLFDKLVTEKTGVEVNIIIPPSDNDENLIAMAASGNMPDIITMNNWSGVREQMIKAGYFKPLNALAKQYAPELLTIVPESMRKWYTQEDGNWYGIANNFTATEWLPKGANIENANGIVARKDIMEKLNIKAVDFNTQEGTINALKKVKDANLTIKGKKIEPFYMEWNDWNMARMWGIPWETSEGNWVDFRVHPKYLEMYKFLNSLWLEGLIDADNFTTWHGNKIQEGACFAYLGNLDSVSGPIANAYNANKEAVYVPVGPIRALDGSEPIYDQAGTGWMTTFITNKSQQADKAIKLLSFLTSDEGQMLTWYGVKGETYTEVNGKIQYTNEYLKMKDEDSEMATKVYGINDFWPLKQPLFNDKRVDKTALPEVEKNYINILNYFSKYSAHTPETMGASPEQGTAEAGILQKIDDYWGKQTRKMVLAKSLKEVEDIYNESVKHIYEMGYEKVYKAADAKFKAQKKKIGKEYSYPLNIK